MAAVTDLADNPAAVAAGYVRVQRQTSDDGLSMFETRYEKGLTELGGTGPKPQESNQVCGMGVSYVDQASADTLALANLNANRRHRYGGSPGRASAASDSPDAYGNTLTQDTN